MSCYHLILYDLLATSCPTFLPPSSLCLLGFKQKSSRCLIRLAPRSCTMLILLLSLLLFQYTSVPSIFCILRRLDGCVCVRVYLLNRFINHSHQSKRLGLNYKNTHPHPLLRRNSICHLLLAHTLLSRQPSLFRPFLFSGAWQGTWLAYVSTLLLHPA